MNSFLKSVGSFLDGSIFMGLAISFCAIPLYIAFSKLNFGADVIGILTNFIEWFGVPYALVLASVLLTAWQQFEAGERFFDREADVISLLFQTATLLDDRQEGSVEVKTLKSDIMRSIYRYVDHVIHHFEDECQEDGNKKFRFSAEGNQILIEEIRSEIGKILRLKQDLLAQELLRLSNEVLDSRGDRISALRQRIKKHLWTLSIVSTIIWLFPFYIIQFDLPTLSAGFDNQLNYIILLALGPGLIFGVTFVVVVILSIISDFNNPFSGQWTLTTDSWESIRKHILKAMNVVERLDVDPRFEIISKALKASGLADSLKSEEAVTFLAPLNKAFTKLPADTVDKLLKPEGKESLERFLLHHIVSGKFTRSDLIKQIKVNTRSNKPISAKLQYDKLSLNDNIQILDFDIEASNGIIHIVDTVILPP